MSAFWIAILSFCIGWYIGAGVQTWLDEKKKNDDQRNGKSL